MSAPKFTPGPWKWSGTPGDSTLEGGKANSYIISQADYEGMWFSRYNEEDEANANLIAAAPDLFAFAEEVRRRCIEMNMPGHEFCTLAEAALSKANPVQS